MTVRVVAHIQSHATLYGDRGRPPDDGFPSEPEPAACDARPRPDQFRKVLWTAASLHAAQRNVPCQHDFPCAMPTVH